jgi:hypothetical protein
MTTTATKEPTNSELMRVLVGMDGRIHSMENRLTGKIDGIEVEMHTMNTRMTDLERSVSKLVVITTDIQEDLAGALKATDDSALKIMSHERRIRVLEKVRAKR